jgi:glycine betaine/proline transport system ATP-binding protein
MGEAILRATGVWKVFGEKASLLGDSGGNHNAGDLRSRGFVVGVEDANLSIAKGECFVIMGLSGSGKSTLLRCLTGLYPSSRGHVEIDGTDLTTASRNELVELRRTKIGMVFQSFALLPHLSALDNVAFPLQVKGAPKLERREKAKQALSLVGLTGLESRFPSQLSGGQQQRVGIARSLIGDPKVWFLDEPFSALDPLTRRDMQDEFMRLQSQLHKTIVFVTHDLEEAVRLGDRIAIMAEGKILQIGTAEDIVLSPATDYVKRFVAGIPREHVVQVRRLMKPVSSKKPASVQPIAETDTLQQVMARIVGADSPLPVTDQAGRIVGSLSRGDVAQWMA